MTQIDDKSAPAILLVEDEGIIANDLRQSLLEMGYDAYAIATTAEEAMACASARCPDIVLMDIRIKGDQDGIDTAKRLKDEFHAAVIYLTAYADDETVERAKHTEPYGYLLKPVKLVELRSMIEISLFRRQLDGAREQAALLDARLKSLIDLSLQLASEHDPRVLLDKVCQSAREMFGAEYAVLAVKEKLTSSPFLSTSGIELADASLAHLTPSIDAGPLGLVCSRNVAWRARAARDGAGASQVLPAGYPDAGCYLAVPITSLTRTYGWLCLAGKQGAEEFTVEDERVLGILAGQAGRIYENGSLYQDLQLHAVQLQAEIDERERSAVNLRRSEERFRQLAENINDVFFIWSADFGVINYCSPAFEQIWGRAADLTNPMDWSTSIHVDDRGRIIEKLEKHVGNPVFDEFEFRIIQPCGDIRWIYSRHFPLYDESGHPYRVVGVATDITDRKLAERKVQLLNRVYAVLSGINALIIRAQTKAELFEGSCRLAVEHGDFVLAWIGSLVGDHARVKPLAWAGNEVLARLLEDGGSIVIDAKVLESLECQMPSVCDDMRVEKPTTEYEKEMIARGLRSIVYLPLIMHASTVGTLVLATGDCASFDAAEMRLLSELAGDISFALDHIEKSDKLSYLAYYDSLTGLANRKLFLERLAQQVEAAKHSDVRFAVVVREPERFENINATFGRNKGDAMLKEAADRLIRCTGDEGTIAYIGADQFASVLPFAGEVDVVVRVLDGQHEAWLGAPFGVDGQVVKLTARAGIAIYPHDGNDAETLLKNAEAALRRASSLGDRAVFFTQEIGDRISERLSMETRLRRALENDEFVLHYQPKVDLETRDLAGVEALIRWRSPHLGLVPPLKFIPLMEETGMIIDVGTWVMRQAYADGNMWMRQGFGVPRIAVNVSSVQLRRPDFLNVVRGVMDGAAPVGAGGGASSPRVDVEVTESLFVENVEANIEKLRELRKLGIEIAIDDFGTGYSSLGYLAKMPVNSLKIDRTFTEAMLSDPGVMTLVSTIITLAHSLRLKVIAEGVELEEQAKILRLLRCDQMQGFLISKPLPFDEMSKLLSRAN